MVICMNIAPELIPMADQGDREGRPYHTTNQPAYSLPYRVGASPRGRPGSLFLIDVAQKVGALRLLAW